MLLHCFVEQLIARYRFQQPGFDGPFHAAAGEVVGFDLGAAEVGQVDGRVAGLEGVHQFHVGVVPVAEDLFGAAPGAGAAVVDVGIDGHVGDEGRGWLQGLQVGRDGREAAGLGRRPRFHVRTHQDPLQARIVVIHQAVAGAAIGLQHVFEIGSHFVLLCCYFFPCYEGEKGIRGKSWRQKVGRVWRREATTLPCVLLGGTLV